MFIEDKSIKNKEYETNIFREVCITGSASPAGELGGAGLGEKHLRQVRDYG